MVYELLRKKSFHNLMEQYFSLENRKISKFNFFSSVQLTSEQACSRRLDHSGDTASREDYPVVCESEK